MHEVRVTKAGQSVTWTDAFTVTSGQPDFVARLSVPGPLAWWFPAEPATFFIESENKGDAAMVAPLLTLDAPPGFAMSSDPKTADGIRSWACAPPGSSTNVQLLAVGSGTTPGILKPGDRGLIPIYHLGTPTGWRSQYPFQVRSTPANFCPAGVVTIPEHPNRTVIQRPSLEATLLGASVTPASFAPPPVHDGVRGELGCAMRGAHQNGAPIGQQVI